jgi:hypothetical protein
MASRLTRCRPQPGLAWPYAPRRPVDSTVFGRGDARDCLRNRDHPKFRVMSYRTAGRSSAW